MRRSGVACVVFYRTAAPDRRIRLFALLRLPL